MSLTHFSDRPKQEKSVCRNQSSVQSKQRKHRTSWCDTDVQVSRRTCCYHRYNGEAIPKSILEDTKKILTAPLKPHQKLTITKKFLIPRYISKCQKPNIAIKTLVSFDKILRKTIKKILYLPSCANNRHILFIQNIPRIMKSRINHFKKKDADLREILREDTP